MKTKHTPGPWIVDNKWEALTIKNIREMPMQNGTIEETILEIAQGFIPNSKNLALIVTAPEMLEVLQLVGTIANISIELSDADYKNRMKRISELATNIINKAKGE